MERGEATPKATGELVERSTYQAYGGTESDYRPERWKSFREDYRFTGKEEDVEVGLIYFGKRFLNPLLNRWVSADPLAIHGLGADPNLYAYVSGHALQAVDPLGLDEESLSSELNNPADQQYAELMASGGGSESTAPDPAPKGHSIPKPGDPKGSIPRADLPTVGEDLASSGCRPSGDGVCYFAWGIARAFALAIDAPIMGAEFILNAPSNGEMSGQHLAHGVDLATSGYPEEAPLALLRAYAAQLDAFAGFLSVAVPFVGAKSSLGAGKGRQANPGTHVMTAQRPPMYRFRQSLVLAMARTPPGC